MEEFFRSVANAFAENREAIPQVEAALVALAGLGLGLAVAAAIGRVRARALALRHLADHRGLSPEDLRLVASLARREGLAPLQLLTELERFERATALALAESPASPEPAKDPADRIRRIRHALGFDRLPGHTPLLTTRELAPGTAVEVAGRRGEIAALDERSFLVVLLGAELPAPGTTLALTLVHAREARYQLRCPVLGARPVAHGEVELALAHDEAPERLQRRAYVRVPVRAPVVLRPRAAGLALVRPDREVRGELIDLSGGGARLTCRAPLPVGGTVSAAFALDGRPFELGAVVLSCTPDQAGGHEVQLEFHAREERERDRLVGALGALEVRGRA